MITATINSHVKIHEILTLRTVVAALGERVEPPWWRTQFLSEVGLRAISRVFPRTAASAAVSSTLIAAREDHDKRIGIGSGGRYHLFRLPSSVEQTISTLMSEPAFSSETAGIVSKNHNELIQELEKLADHSKASVAEGPVRVGSLANLAKAGSIVGLAGHYANSFRTGRRAFPYLDDIERTA